MPANKHPLKTSGINMSTDAGRLHRAMLHQTRPAGATAAVAIPLFEVHRRKDQEDIPPWSFLLFTSPPPGRRLTETPRKTPGLFHYMNASSGFMWPGLASPEARTEGSKAASFFRCSPVFDPTVCVYLRGYVPPPF
jgi:hypothetical protein